MTILVCILTFVSVVKGDFGYSHMISFLTIGHLLNLLAIVANGNQMPVRPRRSMITKLVEKNPRKCLWRSDIKLPLLTDVIDLYIVVCSIGDLLMFIGWGLATGYVWQLCF